MKKIFALIFAIISFCVLVSCGDNENGGNGGSSEFETTHKAIIEIENYGTIKLDLYGICQ